MNNAEVKVAVEGQETERAVQLSPQKKNVDKARILFILATVGPAFVLFILFVIFPVFSMWYNSMVEWDGIGEKVFVWFDNYKVLFEDETFWKSFTNTLFLIAVVTVFTIGLSLYPYDDEAEDWQAAINRNVDDCIANINTIYDTFRHDVMIVEIGMPYNMADETYDMLTRLITEAKGTGHCLGVFYWEPETPESEGYNMGAFENNMPTHALDAFTEAAAADSGSSEDSGSNE